MKNFSSINRMKAKGFSLIEILLVIGIIAVLAIAAFIIFPQVQASSRANTEQSNIMTTAAGVKNLFNGRYAGVSNTTLIDAEIFPSSMVTGATTAASSWGGTVDVVSPVGTPGQFTISYAGLEKSVCLKLVPGLLQNFESVGVGAATLDKDSTTADVVAACQVEPVGLVLTSN